MNSYPLEPLMFVAGLKPPADADADKPGRRRGSSSAGLLLGDAPPRTSVSSVSGPSPAAGADAGLTSPIPAPPALPPMSPEDIGLGSGPDAPMPPADEFDKLTADLRAVFALLTRPARVWLPEAERRDFRVALVDKNVRMPLRKISATGSTAGGKEAGPMHSPLSPLTPSSPLYPDGLIAPVWVRKHSELVPSVFVLFLRMYEAPKVDGESPAGNDARAEAAKQQEREADDALVREISERRRRLTERGIKLTLVLMASPAALESRSLDQRLSHIRRQSSLSAKASLFVLTPVPASELPDFVRSLQDALYDAAMDYYATHSKRVRRKRQKVPQNSSSRERSGSMAAAGNRSRSGSMAANPLSPQGWAVRYDWKAGWFAEVRGDLDLARRHYEDCWNELARLFSSTTALPPRTKRWAEAKVLADCVAVKIYKLLLYEGAGGRVLVPFFVHLRRFAEMSRGWGIGDETFEFWSWVARQYRIFGEVLETAESNHFQIPSLPAPTYPTPAANMVPPLTVEELSIPLSSSNPLHVLHPTAYYFYCAATSTMERKARFEEALNAENASGSVALAAAPGFTNEKNVDHTALIVELLTKSYNLLKESYQENSHFGLYIAFRTAQVHYKAGQFDPAMKYLDSIAEKYSQDEWEPLVQEIRSMLYDCAQHTGRVETAARLLVEMMGPGGKEEDRGVLQEDLKSLLNTTAPSSTEPIAVDLLKDDAPLAVRAGFRQAEAACGTSVPFQVSIGVPEGVDISQLSFSQLRIGFGDHAAEVVVSHGGSSRFVDVGSLGMADSTGQAPLHWNKGEQLVVAGTLKSDSKATVEVTDVTLVLTEGSWTLELRLVPGSLLVWSTEGGRAYTPVKGLFPTVAFIEPQHSINLDITPPPVAFVGEQLPITVRVENTDERRLVVRLAVLLHHGEQLDDSTVSVGGETSDSLVEGVALGTLAPGTAAEQIIILTVPEAGTKLLDIAVSSELEAEPDGAPPEAQNVTKTAVVPVIPPFTISSTAKTDVNGATPPVSGHATVSAVLQVPGPRPIVVESVTVTAEDSNVELVGCSVSSAAFPMTWNDATSFALGARFSLHTGRMGLSAPPQAHSAVVRVLWRPADAAGAADAAPRFATVLPLPSLVPPAQEAFVSASVRAPAVVQAHTPFRTTLSLANVHPTEPAWFALHGETEDGFVWAGPRGARVGPVAPGSHMDIDVSAVAVGAPGWQALPSLSAWHGDSGDRREVRVAPAADRPSGAVFVHP